ncbi:MAG: hypothetical protein AAF698_12215, partial [Pseudomonadota bacterium]
LRESAYEWAAAAREFFEALPLDEMVDADALTTGTNGSDEVLAKEGEVYAIYLRDGGSATLDLGGVSGNFAVRWYDVIDGTYHEGSVTSVSGGGKVSLGQAPNDPNGEWAILVQSDGTAPPADPDPDPEPPVADGDPVYLMEDGRVVMQAETGVFLIDGAAGNDTWKLVQDKAGYKGEGYLLFDTDTDYFNGSNAGQPQTGPMKYTFRIDDPDAAGTYYITLRSTKPNTGEPNDRNNDFFVTAGAADEPPSGWKKVFFSGGANQWLWGRTYDVNHEKSPATFEVDGPGEYTIFVSGRSRQAAFDEIHVQKGRASTDHDAPTSPLATGSTPPPPPPPDEPDEPDNPPPDQPDPPAGDLDFTLALIDIANG